MSCLRRHEYEAEVTYTNKDGAWWRYPVNLINKTCSCMLWEISGKPCVHAMFLLNVIGEKGKVDLYVSEYFSVANFRTYADNVPALL